MRQQNSNGLFPWTVRSLFGQRPTTVQSIPLSTMHVWINVIGHHPHRSVAVRHVESAGMSATEAAEGFLAESILRRFTRRASPAIYIPIESRVHVDIVSGIGAEIRSVGIVTGRIEVLLAHHVSV